MAAALVAAAPLGAQQAATVAQTAPPTPGQATAFGPTALYRANAILALRDSCEKNNRLELKAGVMCADVHSFVDAPYGQAGKVDSLYSAAKQLTAISSSDRMRGLAASAPSVGNVDAGSALVTGLTNFLVTRALEEIVDAFFIRVGRTFTSQPVVQALLPKTAGVVAHIESLGYNELLPSLEASFTGDLGSLPRNLHAKWSEIGSGSEPVLVQAAAAFAGPVQSIAAGASPLAALSTLARVDSGQVLDSRLRCALRVVGQLAAEKKNAGFDYDRYAAMALSDVEQRRVYAVILAHDAGIPPASQVACLGDANAQFLADAADRIADIRQVTNAQADKSTGSETQSQRAQAVLASVARALEVSAECMRDTGKNKDSTDVVTASHLIDALSNGLASHDWRPLVADVLGLVDPLLGKQTDLARLITLGASLASATSADQVSQALTAAADPVGSFRARRQPGKFTASIVSYFGGEYGTEWLLDLPAWATTHGKEIGVAVPLGIEFAWGTTPALLWPFTSTGLLISVVDVGTLVSYRISNGVSVTSAKADPNTTLAQLFAPGASLVMGITRDLPISWGIGAEYAPQMRNTSAYGVSNVLRVSVFFGIDLTLLRF